MLLEYKLRFFKLKEEIKVKGETAENQATHALEWLYMNEYCV